MNYREKIDYSSLSKYLECPRKHLFSNYLHLQPTSPNLNLFFGSCWHYGLEIAYKALKNDSNVSKKDIQSISCEAFNNAWKVDGDKFDLEMSFPKNPARAMDMYYGYWNKYFDIDKTKEIVSVEEPIVISLGIGYPDYIGKIDLILKNSDGSLDILDHKTSKSLYKILPVSYVSSLQTSAYITAIKVFSNKLATMTYNVAVVQKGKLDYERFSYYKNNNDLDRFLFIARHYSLEIINNIHGLETFMDSPSSKDRNAILPCFHPNPGTACTTYMSACTYFNLCHMRNNPLLWKDDAPDGFKIEEWDPETVGIKEYNT
jgi:hypothetical protein